MMAPVRVSTPPQKLRAVWDTSKSPCPMPATRNRPEWKALTEEPPGKSTLPTRPPLAPDSPCDQPIASTNQSQVLHQGRCQVYRNRLTVAADSFSSQLRLEDLR